jgi:hypothetical protein
MGDYLFLESTPSSPDSLIIDVTEKSEKEITNSESCIINVNESPLSDGTKRRRMSEMKIMSENDFITKFTQEAPIVPPDCTKVN